VYDLLYTIRKISGKSVLFHNLPQPTSLHVTLRLWKIMEKAHGTEKNNTTRTRAKDAHTHVKEEVTARAPCKHGTQAVCG
jgi:hypothetical protein